MASPDLTFCFAPLSTQLLTADELGAGGEYWGFVVAPEGETLPSLTLLTLLTLDWPLEFLAVYRLGLTYFR